MTPLTQELIELSGWQPDGEDFTVEFLLEKLPHIDGEGRPELVKQGTIYSAWLNDGTYPKRFGVHADTPLEALKLLAIELFRQGVLKREGK